MIGAIGNRQPSVVGRGLLASRITAPEDVLAMLGLDVLGGVPRDGAAVDLVSALEERVRSDLPVKYVAGIRRLPAEVLLCRGAPISEQACPEHPIRRPRQCTD